MRSGSGAQSDRRRPRAWSTSGTAARIGPRWRAAPRQGAPHALPPAVEASAARVTHLRTQRSVRTQRSAAAAGPAAPPAARRGQRRRHPPHLRWREAQRRAARVSARVDGRNGRPGRARRRATRLAARPLRRHRAAPQGWTRQRHAWRRERGESRCALFGGRHGLKTRPLPPCARRQTQRSAARASERSSAAR
jgi:hypothetical protein